MNEPAAGIDYTRISDEANVLCRRQDFPRAVNSLERRAPEHRRWRDAFRLVATRADSSSSVTEGRRNWMRAALRNLVDEVSTRWLRAELSLDLSTVAPDLVDPLRPMLPVWTARDVWREADRDGIPMEYIVKVTTLPDRIDAAVNTAHIVRDFRASATAHTEYARTLASNLTRETLLGAASADAQREQGDLMRSHLDAAARWRGLARRLLLGGD